CNDNNSYPPPEPVPPKPTIIITEVGKWKLTEYPAKQLLEIEYNKTNQCAAIHKNSSYMRLTYSHESAWGTSFILFPSFWKKTGYYQGTPISVKISRFDTDTENLFLEFCGENQGIKIQGHLTIFPPANDQIQANVSIYSLSPINAEEIDFEGHPNEAFKPLFLSSMRISDNYWDTNNIILQNKTIPIPSQGFIITSPENVSTFGLQGGLSDWQKENSNYPAVSITVDMYSKYDITGYVTQSNDPNDDNVGVWAALNKYNLHPNSFMFSYKIFASKNVVIANQADSISKDVKDNSSWR
ncbi:hypothetical protein KKC59_03515, partial [bacterium]|nr:hypothetical protein [bacterium]